MSDLKVVPIGVPNLADLPAALRNLADKLESGAIETPATQIAVGDMPGEHPDIFAFGTVPTHNQVVGLLQRAVITAALTGVE